MENEIRDVSEFNGSQLKLFRIDEAIRGINMCRHQLDLSQWLFYLHDLDMELESVKKVDEKKALDIELKMLSDKVNAFTSNKHTNKKNKPLDIIDGLNSYQKKLLFIFKSSGLEMKLAGDSMSGMGKRG